MLVPITIILDATPDGFASAQPIDPAALGALLADITSPNGRHVVVADTWGEHRLWLRETTPDRPMAAVIPLDRDFHTRIDSLLRFHRRLFNRPAGPQPRGWALSAYRQARLRRMLRALDLHLGGASYREIAVALGENTAAQVPANQWKVSSSRSAVIRLVRDGRAMMDGGYRKLLRIR